MCNIVFMLYHQHFNLLCQNRCLCVTLFCIFGFPGEAGDGMSESWTQSSCFCPWLVSGLNQTCVAWGEGKWGIWAEMVKEICRRSGFSEALLSPPASFLLCLDALTLPSQVNFSPLQKDLNISCIHSIASKCIIPETINELSQTLRFIKAEDLRCSLIYQKVIAKHGNWILPSWGPSWCLLPQPWGVLHLLQRCPDVSPLDGAWVTAWSGW